MALWIVGMIPVMFLGLVSRAQNFAGAEENVVGTRSLYHVEIEGKEMNDSSGKKVCVTTEKLLDVAMLMDTSMTTDSVDLANTAIYIFELTKAFELGVGKTRVALARFVNQTALVSDFNQGTSHTALQQIIRSQTYQVSGIPFNTAEALTFAANSLFTGQNGIMKNGAKKILIFITFTRIGSDSLFIAARDEVDSAGLEVFVVAVGQADATRDLLKSLVTREFSDYVHFAASNEMGSDKSLRDALVDANGMCDQCLSNPCVHGTCSSAGTFQCQCSRGYRGPTCSEIDHCVQGNPCHGELCNNPSGNIIECTCITPGRYGPLCEFFNVCDAHHNACHNGGTCQHNNKTMCHCPAGYYGHTCDQVDQCVVANPCLNQGVCSHDRSSGQTFCKCVSPYTGATCSDCNCQNNGMCTLTVATGRCVCPPNCNGSLCENCMPYCTVNPGVCRNGATCNSTGLTYECICAPHCAGRHCETCSAGSCSMPIVPCPLGHVCHDLPAGGYVCTCPQGCVGAFCQLCGYCSTLPSPCLNGGLCIDQPANKFSCQCQPNYAGSVCENYVYCENHPQACLNGGTCVNLNHNFTCLCPPHCSGPLCGTCTLPCDRVPGPCKNGATCENVPPSAQKPDGDFACQCVDGCLGRTCVDCPIDCTVTACQNGGTCKPSVGFGIPTCDCTHYCYGFKCEYCLPFCVIHPLICVNGGTCQNLPGGNYACQCTENCGGKNCDECPCLSYPCHNGGTCTAIQGANPTCQCTSAYVGLHCEIDNSNNAVNPCLPNPCLNGCQCIESFRHSGGYLCKGTQGFIGKNCQIDPPTLDCLPRTIEIRVSEDFARTKARSGNMKMEMYVGSLDSVARVSGCSATQPVNGEYRITLQRPSLCVNVQRRRSGSKERVTGEVWVNMLPDGLGGFTADMPVPIAAFECVYHDVLTFVTSLRPVMTEVPTISEEVRFVPQASLCTSDTCPNPCPSRLSIDREAVYAVGETIHVMISTKRLGKLNTQFAMHATLSRLRLTCAESPQATGAGLELVSAGCTSPADDPANVDFALGRSGVDDVICLSFKAARLGACRSRFFVHADLRICAGKDLVACPEGPQVLKCVRNRRRRRSSSKERPIVIGPFYVFESGSARLNVTDDEFDKLDLPENQPASDDPPAVPSSVLQYAAVAFFTLVTVAASVCVLFLLRRSSVARSSYALS